MKNKIVFFDIDGTILNDELVVLESTKNAIKQMQEKGIEVVIASGRNYRNFKKILHELNLDTYISINGQYVVYKGKEIYSNPYPSSFLNDFLDFSLKQGNPAVLVGNDEIYNSMGNDEFTRRAFHFIDYELPQLDRDVEDIPTYQIVLICDGEEEKKYQEKFPSNLFVRFHEKGTDVLPAGASKAAGIKKLIDYLGVEKEDTYAFGDGLNDLEMVQYVANGVAMENGKEELKKVAKFVTDTNNNDGIFKALKHFGLVE